MPFSRGFMLFAQRLPVVPVALQAALPWGLHTHTLTSSFAANMFWFCFAPWVRLDAVALPPMRFCEVCAPAPAVHSSCLGWCCSSCNAGFRKLAFNPAVHMCCLGWCCSSGNASIRGTRAPQHSVLCNLARAACFLVMSHTLPYLSSQSILKTEDCSAF